MFVLLIMQNYIAIGYQLIKIGISSSAATLEFMIKNCKTNRRCDMKSCDRACPVAAVACFDRHVTKSLINVFNLNKVP